MWKKISKGRGQGWIAYSVSVLAGRGKSCPRIFDPIFQKARCCGCSGLTQMDPFASHLARFSRNDAVSRSHLLPVAAWPTARITKYSRVNNTPFSPLLTARQLPHISVLLLCRGLISPDSIPPDLPNKTPRTTAPPNRSPPHFPTAPIPSLISEYSFTHLICLQKLYHIQSVGKRQANRTSRAQWRCLQHSQHKIIQ